MLTSKHSSNFGITMSVLFQLSSPFVKVQFVVIVNVSFAHGPLDVTETVVFEGESCHSLVESLLEVLGDLDLALLTGQVSLHFGVSVVDDGQEHVEQDEEHEKDIGEEHNWTQNTIGCFQSVEVEVSQDYSKQGEAEMTSNINFHIHYFQELLNKILGIACTERSSRRCPQSSKYVKGYHKMVRGLTQIGGFLENNSFYLLSLEPVSMPFKPSIVPSSPSFVKS